MSGRLGRFANSPGVTTDYLGIERERADRMEHRAERFKTERDELIEVLREVCALYAHHEDSWDFHAARVLLKKYPQ